MTSKIYFAGFLTLAALGAAGVFASWWIVTVAPYRGARFTPEDWAAGWACNGLSAPDCEIQRAACPRGPMLRDLRARLQSGLTTETEVTALLGPGNGAGPGCLQWPLGICTPFSVDWTAFTACFDGDGRLTTLSP